MLIVIKDVNNFKNVTKLSLTFKPIKTQEHKLPFSFKSLKNTIRIIKTITHKNKISKTIKIKNKLLKSTKKIEIIELMLTISKFSICGKLSPLKYFL